MPAWLTRLRQRLSRPVLIWAAITAVFGLLVLISLSHLAGVPAQETMRANSTQQRVIIDPKTGLVSGLGGPKADAQPFEVADDKTTVAEEEKPVAEESVNEAPMAQEETPVDEPATEATEATPDNGNYTPLTLSRAEARTPLVPRSSESLVSAPAPEISEKVGNEMLPMRGDKEARAATLYARNFQRSSADQRLVAIVVTDVGFNGDVLKQVIELPSTITAGVSPYADAPADQITALRNKGHEVWAMLPVMGARYPQDDPGPLGLINALTIKSALTRLHTLMANTIGSVGFILPPDESLSTSQKDLWRAAFDEIDTRGLYVLSTHPTRDAKALTADSKQQEHIRRADIVLDSTPGAAFVRSKLAGLKDIAAKQQNLIVLVSARPQALTLLAEWLNTNPLDGVATLAPLSAVYNSHKAPAKAPEGDKAGGKEESSGGL